MFFHFFKVITHFMAYYIKIFKIYSSQTPFTKFNAVIQELAYYIKILKNIFKQAGSSYPSRTLSLDFK